jgi:hypothetical protein
MLTFSEFKNILQLIASDDSECRILGQELAKQYKFECKCLNYYNDLIHLDNTNYIVFKDRLHALFGGHASDISYEQAYEKYITSHHTKGIL